MLGGFPRRKFHSRQAIRYSVALGTIALAVGLSALLLPWIEQTPSTLFTAAVVVTAWYGGIKPGIVAAVLAVLGRYFIFFQDEGFFGASNLVHTGLFFAVALLIGSLFEQLQRQRDSMKVSFRSIGDGAITTDETGRVTFVNPVAETLTGIPAAEAVGHPVEEVFKLVSEDTQAPKENPVSWALRERQVFRLSDHLALAGAERQYSVQICAAPILTATHQLAGAVMVFRDVTEARQQMEALRVSEERFRVMAETVPDIVFTTGPDGLTDYINAHYYEYTGMLPGSALGWGWQQAVHPEDAEKMKATWLGCLQSGALFEFRHRLRKADGSFRWFMARARPVVDREGKIVKWFGTCSDIHDLIQAQRELETAKEQVDAYAANLEHHVAERTAALQETVASLEGVLYTIAHDLRAPLRAMRGFTLALSEDYAPRMDETGKDYCDRIYNAAGRMDSLISDLLEYGQLAHRDLPAEAVNLEDEVHHALMELAQDIKARAARMEVHRPLQPVWANATVMRQILLNLVSNALKFVRSGTTPHVVIRTEATFDRVRLWVEDNGIGIEPAFHEKIFQIFQRLHANEIFPGTGIGLAIVKKGVERMGGKIGLESQLGKGSRFWIDLPSETAGRRQLLLKFSRPRETAKSSVPAEIPGA